MPDTRVRKSVTCSVGATNVSRITLPSSLTTETRARMLRRPSTRALHSSPFQLSLSRFVADTYVETTTHLIPQTYKQCLG